MDAGNLGVNGNIRSKILLNFIRGKISLTPMETILIVSRELEYFERSCEADQKEEACSNYSITCSCNDSHNNR